jgi:hypothetical protein
LEKRVFPGLSLAADAARKPEKIFLKERADYIDHPIVCI